MSDSSKATWHHAPVHVFVPNALYMVTGATLHKQHFFRGCERLSLLQENLLKFFVYYGWEVSAWAVFSNHYHVVAKSPESAKSLSDLLKQFHAQASKAVNALDGVAGRQVLYQYRDKCLTYEKSYFARLNYVNQNAVKHGLVRTAADYPYCSAARFQQHFRSAFLRKLASYKYDRVKEWDDFEPEYV